MVAVSPIEAGGNMTSPTVRAETVCPNRAASARSEISASSDSGETRTITASASRTVDSTPMRTPRVVDDAQDAGLGPLGGDVHDREGIVTGVDEQWLDAQAGDALRDRSVADAAGALAHGHKGTRSRCHARGLTTRRVSA